MNTLISWILSKKSALAAHLRARDRYFLLVAPLAIVLVCLAFSPVLFRIQSQYSLSQFQPKNHPLLSQSKDWEKRFRLKESTTHSLLLSLKKSNWLETSKIKKLSKFTQHIENDQRVLKAISLTNIPLANSNETSMVIGTLKQNPNDKQLKSKLRTNPLVVPNLLSKDSKHTVIYIETKDLSLNENQNAIEKFLKWSGQHLPEADVQWTGPTAIKSEMTEILGHELYLFLGLAVLGSLIFLLIVFSNLGPVATILGLVFVCVLLGLQTLYLLEFPFTILTSTLPILIAIVVVSISSHTYIRVAEETFLIQNSFLAKKKASTVYREILGSHILTSVITSVGFATLGLSDIPLIRQYGLIVSLSVVISCFVVLLCLPATLHYLPLPRTRLWQNAQVLLAQRILRFRKQIVFGVLGLLVLGIGLSTALNWKPRLLDDLPEKNSARKTTEFVDKKLGGVVPMDLIVSGKSEFWKRPNHLQKMDALAENLRQFQGVGSVVSLVDFIKSTQPGNIVPRSPASIHETLFLFDMTDDTLTRHYLSEDGRHYRLSLRLKDVRADESQKLLSRIQEKVKTIFPEAKVYKIGTGAIVHTMSAEVSKELLWGFFQALLVIIVLLIFVFRSVTWALVSALPNFVPPATIMIALVLFNVPIKPAVALIFSISLGIAFTNTVYLLKRLKVLQREPRREPKDIIETLVASEIFPCLISSLALFFGFGVFTFSQFEMNQTFGLLMITSIAAGLLGDLVFLPCLLSLFPNLLNGDAFLIQKLKTWLGLLNSKEKSL